MALSNVGLFLHGGLEAGVGDLGGCSTSKHVSDVGVRLFLLSAG
jgi:hypothetical protein